MKKLLIICVVAFVIVEAEPLWAATLEVRPPGGVGTLGDVYTSIQDAIDDACDGDTITVHEGTYTEQLTIIDKDLTLQGVAASTTIIEAPASMSTVLVRGGSQAMQAVVNVIGTTGHAIAVDIKEFTVDGSYVAPASSSTWFAGIAYSNADGTVENNIVTRVKQETLAEGSASWRGHCIWLGDASTVTVKGNTISEWQRNGVEIRDAAATATITGNTFTGYETAYTVVNAVTFYSATDGTVTGNTVTDCRYTGAGSGNDFYGGTQACGIMSYEGSGTFTVTGNTVQNCDIAIYSRLTSAGIISDNTLENNLYFAIVFRKGDVTATGNTITGSEVGILVPSYRPESGSAPTANNNTISGNLVYGVRNDAAYSTDARYNWWGDATGPYHPVTNTGGLGDEVSDNVDYYPWYTDSDMTTLVYKPVHNVTLDAYYDTIQGAIDAAREADTITADLGTYNESVTINVNNLTLHGIPGSLPAITGGLKLDTDLAGLRLENFYVSGNAVPTKNSVVRMYGAITDLTIDNCVFDGENVSGRLGFSGGRLEGDVTITNCELKNILGWAVLDSRSGSGGDGSATGTVTFANNNIHHCNGSIVFRGLSTDRTDVVNAYGNTWTNIGGNSGETGEQWAALEINRTVSANVYNNTVDGVAEGQWSEGQALQLWNIDTLDVHDNTFINNFQGIYVHGSDPAYGGALAIPGGSIYCNTISGNSQYGISVDAAATGGPLDAEYNWWGDASGPSGEGGGIGDAVLGNVDFFPWLLSEDCNDFTLRVADFVVDDDWEGLPDWTTVTVGSIDYYIGLNAFDTIQEAVDAAIDGNSISVAAGNYVGVIVDEDLMILGANPGGSVITSGVPYEDDSSLETAFRLDAGADGTEIKNFTVDCNMADNFFFAVFSRGVNDVIVNSLTVNKTVQGITNWGGSDWQITNNALNETGAASGGGIAILVGGRPPGYPIARGNLIEDNIMTPTATAPDYTCPAICVSLDLRYGGYEAMTGSEDVSYNRIVRNDITGTGLGSEVGVEVGVIGVSDDPNKIAATLGLVHDNLVRGNLIDSTDWGVYFYTVADLDVLGNEIVDCNEGIYIQDSHKGTLINYNTIYGSVSYGVNNTGGVPVDASYNWWGDVSGPYDPCGTSETDGVACYDVSTMKNADGLGDAVTDNVDYCPWLTAAVSPSDYPYQPGDVNYDGCVNWQDVATLALHWLEGCQ
jgi:parallel beta-helix repeat protein